MDEGWARKLTQGYMYTFVNIRKIIIDILKKYDIIIIYSQTKYGTIV